MSPRDGLRRFLPANTSRTLRRGDRRTWTRVGAVATAPAVLAALALVYPGQPVSQVDLNDAGVWLTNTSALKLGRFNSVIDELNGGLVTTATEFDVLQDASDVLLVEPGAVAVIDPASVTPSAQTVVPRDALVSMAAGTVAVVDPADGSLWVRPTSALGALRTDADDADLELGEGGAAVVARDGTVVAIAADGAVSTLVTADDGTAGVSEPGDAGTLAAAPPTGWDQVTAVGDQPVALAGRTLHTLTGPVDLARYGDALALQQPGPASGTVLVASSSALLEVPLDGGEVREHESGGSGKPAAPVLVDGCARAAWATPRGSFLAKCGDGAPEVLDLEGMTTRDELVFRVNRSVVVLNDTLAGRLWVPLEDPELREPNWQDIQPQEETQDDEQEADSQQSEQNLLAECTAQSAPPTANDDDYGVRPGRSTVLSVIDNDSSSDCGILAISEFDPLPPEFGTLAPIHGGRALQLQPADGARGSAAFTYTVTDGRGSSAPSTARVQLTIRPDGENGAPAQVRVGSVVVEQGAQASYEALADFTDPDGDDLVLVGASTEQGGTVRSRQDGQVTFQADGGQLGRVQVRLLVSDGVETVDGLLLVDVRPAGSLAPLIDPVHAVTYVDTPVTVRALDAVRSSSREPARLAGVDEVPGATVVPDLAAGTFSFSAARPGSYYVTFLVTASPQQATGVARVDVRERPGQPEPPTAVGDRALLPPGGEVTIDPLGNDVDPGGAVLVLQSVEVPAESGLRVATLGHQLLRITATRVLEGPVVLRYVVSNGTAQATGEILVRPVPAGVTQQAPVVENIAVSVRTGGVVTVPVLDHAYDPDGDELTLVRELAEPLPDGQGLLFVSGDLLRYQAPTQPTTARATFAVTDAVGNVTAAVLTVTVHASDPQTKAPPRPRSLEARVFASETVRIQVPLVGIDPDGDGVSLLGQDQVPTKGRITAVGADWLEYQALPGELGTDQFTYAVEDWVGQRAVATVRVGIAARPTTAAAVIARNDDVTVRPGQQVEVRVLANDVDPGGAELQLAPDLELAEGVDARVEGRRIVVRAPDAEAVLQIAYTATNERGGRDSAVLTVTVSNDATVLPPVAQDVVVPPTDTVGRTEVEVDVLAVAQNPSGPLSDLAVSVHPTAASTATVTPGGAVVVTLVETAQTLPYVLTNTNPQADGLSTYAFITVPALGDFPPMLRPRAAALEVLAGEELVIPLAEQVQVAPGRTATISDPAKVQATKADGSPLWRDGTTLTYRAPRTYAGPASISFEVTDATGPGDLEARTKVLTLPITVYAVEDYPPAFVPSVIDVAPGEASMSVDLTAFTSAPVGTGGAANAYRYAITSAVPQGFSATLDGSVLRVAAETTAPKGTFGTLGLSIGYGVGGSMDARVELRVIASTRPLARVVDVTVADGVEGRASNVPVLAGASNPFPGSPLALRGATVETPGAGTAAVAGDQVSVRPAAGFIGTMVTRFSVRDATGDPQREVEGRVTVVVRGRPATPTAPRVVEVRDRTVVLAWVAPVNNGEAITGYRVTANPGGIVRDCASTTCTIDNLVNDTEYTFTVAARNAVDWSDPSPVSPPARPDAVPDAPGAPVLQFGDGQVTATWAAPTSPGSPVDRYTVEISPAPRSGGAVTTRSTSQTFTGLTNGTEYTVRVKAFNRLVDGGPWSTWSAPMVPARPPEAPALTASRRSSMSAGQGTIDVTWGPPATNGDPVNGFELVVNRGTPVALPGSATSWQLTGAQRGRDYTFTIRARNKAGWGAWGEATGATWSAPSEPLALAAADAGRRDAAWGEGAVRLSWQAPADPGGDDVWIDAYEIEGPQGTRRVGGGSTEETFGGLTAGPSPAYRLRAINRHGEVSQWVAFPSAQVTTAAESPDVTADVTVLDEVTIRWAPRSDGGSPYTRFRYSVDNRSWTEVAGDQRSVTIGLRQRDRGDDFTVYVQAGNARGWSTSGQVSGTFASERAPEPGPTPTDPPAAPPAAPPPAGTP
ncbi:Ig-like domain-containing protein [Cellulomonas fimi]|uniref:Ig-like domain-containing protein n=1 Tax=Cellulomonas fimi TaxID=1708 RepID=UPI0028936B41|nr:Ig-like domain-containing protein [Cellulomonas fimi]